MVPLTCALLCETIDACTFKKRLPVSCEDNPLAYAFSDGVLRALTGFYRSTLDAPSDLLQCEQTWQNGALIAFKARATAPSLTLWVSAV